MRQDLYQQAWSVVEMDFQAYFTSIPHNKLLEVISRRISDASLVKLIKQTLKIGISHKGSVQPTKIGVPQGSPTSPLYSNIYLNVIDRKWQEEKCPEKLGATLHRYADDAVLVCRKSAQTALQAFSEMAREMRLTLNSKKTRITKLTQGFDFLGIHFIKQKSLKGGRNTIYLHPSKQAQQSIRNRLKSWTSRNAPINPETFVEQIKPIVWGWVNYFKHTNASKAFKGLQRFINIRFRRYLTHRRKGHGFGWKKYPNSRLYAMGMPYIAGGVLEHQGTLAHGSR
ncbi:reverse transcriptase domain-containing protein [Candidatus Glomeribacter gigasporarum]|uniref:reverse transcriptase domain-containing protein n=1 Tax=Candidatus Glomeribacter gigasporarum TaxID=132144 RepID=UPI0023B16133|nr:reverse transcriptase domain-containing protein [Candidatus Glomeribacter gigasporarum]